MNRLVALGVLILVAGCDGGVPTPLGDPVLNVVAGDGQTTEAPRDTLDQPVVAQLGRKPGGGITFRLVKDLHAQTQVIGIAGVQVCAVGITDNPLQPWNPCATTDASGLATFFFDPGTKAGVAMAEIRAVVDGQKVVTDTAVALVEPGPYVGGYTWQSNLLKDSVVTIDAEMMRDAYGNVLPYRLVSADTLITIGGDTIGTAAARTIHWPQDATYAARGSLPDGICGRIAVETEAGVVADSAHYTIRVNVRELSVALGKPDDSAHLCN